MDVSYLVTVYNKENEISETISSLQKQENIGSLSIEIICVDDLSNDDSVNILKSLREDDTRIKIIQNKENIGPSKSLNLAANFAEGRYLIPVDGDDFLPKDVTRFLLDTSKKHNTELVFGISKRLKTIPEKVKHLAEEEFHSNPLEFCLNKKIVHMGFLVHKNLWLKSGGVDEKVFIQDMSLPIRLAANATSLVYVNSVVYCLRDESDSNLSNNTDQQHHDRYLTYLNLLEDFDGRLSKKAIASIHDQLISSIWKIKRDNSKLPIFSSNFILYSKNKLFGYQLSKIEQKNWYDNFSTMDSIRRVT